MYLYEIMLLIICPLIFCAGFVDAVAGGGGIISLLAYIFAGFPIHIAYGTNKFASCIGTSIASAKFFKSGNIKIKSTLLAAFGALIGSWFGAHMALKNGAKIIRPIIVVVITMLFVKVIYGFLFTNN